MIKVYATVASVGFLVAVTGAGCSSANTPDEGSGGTTSTPTAGTATGTAGTTVIPAGGTGTGTAGTASTPTAGTATGTAGTAASTAGTSAGGTGAGTAGTGAGGANAACKGIKSNMACTVEGTECLNLACGLADSGVRSCKCATNWTCAACDFTGSPFATKPADITTCTTEADKLDCTGMMGKVCEGAAGGEVCACAADDEGSLIWDCDKPPSTWAAAAAQ